MKAPLVPGWNDSPDSFLGGAAVWERATGFGIRTGKYPDGTYLVVLDVDNKAPTLGDPTIPPDLPIAVLEPFKLLSDVRVPVVRTGGGGYHLFFRSSKPLASPVGLLKAPGSQLDIRCAVGEDYGKDSQVVAPGSKHRSGRTYTYFGIHPSQEFAADPAAAHPSGDAFPSYDELPMLPDDWFAILTKSSSSSSTSAAGDGGDWLSKSTAEVDDKIAHLVQTLTGSRPAKVNAREAYKLAKKGKPFAEPGKRNDTMISLAGYIVVVHPTWRRDDVEEKFQASFDAMASEEGAPTMELFLDAINRMHRKQREEQRKAEEEGRAVPSIQVTTKIGDMSDAAMEALVRFQESYKYGIFRRGPFLVEPSQMRSAGVLTNVTPSMLTRYLSQVADWYRFGSDDRRVPTYPPQKVVDDIKDTHNYQDIREIKGVASDYLLRSDGTLAGPGYDPVTGYYIQGTGKAPELLPRDVAIAAIEDLLQDFVFADPSLDHGVALAIGLSIVGHYVHKGSTPFFYIGANVPGTGKTLLAELLTTTTRPDGFDDITIENTDEPEQRKLFTSMAWANREFMFVDNVVGKFGSGPLAKAATLGDRGWSDRLLNTNDTVSIAWRPFMLLTGNNVTFINDLPRRIVRCQLQTERVDPQNRTDMKYKEEELRAMFVERADYYRLAWTSILAHFLSSKKQVKLEKPLGGYTEWGKVIRACVVDLGYADPANAALVNTGDDLDLEDRTILIGILSEFFPGYITQQEVRRLVSDAKHSQKILEALAPYRERDIATISSKEIGAIFDTIVNKPTENGKLVRAPVLHHTRRWVIERKKVQS